MRTEDVLELISSAPKRYKTVRAAVHYRGHGPTLEKTRQSYFESEAGKQETGPVGQQRSFKSDLPDGPFGWRCRVWFAGVRFAGEGNRYRLELELPREVVPGNGLDISAWDGRAVGPGGTATMLTHRIAGNDPSRDPSWIWLAQDSYWTTYLFAPDRIASLTSLLDDLDLKTEAPVFQAGREAVRLVGVPVEEWAYDPDPLRWGADEYEVVVDAERGVLLRCAARLDGVEFDALEVEEIHFDEQLPEGVFTSREPLPWD
jgi:hypothetical protein